MSINLIFIGLLILLFLSFFGNIEELKTNTAMYGIRWWWIFLIIGIFLAFYVYGKTKDENEEKNNFSDGIDSWIGIVGSLALLCITGIIFMSSYAHFLPGYKKQDITEFIGLENIETLSGWVLISKWYNSIQDLDFDRKTDTLSALIWSGGVQNFFIFGKKDTYKNELEEWLKPIVVNNILYKVNNDGLIFSWGIIRKDFHVLWGNTLFQYNGFTGKIISGNNSWNMSFTWEIENPIISKNGTVLLWEEKKDGKIAIMKQGKQIGELYDTILDMKLSPTGSDAMILAENSGIKNIIKNGEKIGTLPADYITWSYQSNGTIYSYNVWKNNSLWIVINGQEIDKKYEEIRDIFLEDDGYSYAYFARPLGEATYCIFTRYKGNLCGLDAYMNPRLWADGGSLLFAGEKNGTWSIYRNIEKIVKETGYTNTDIRYDYMFLDTTTPRTFLFIKKNSESGKYELIKNGKLLPQYWSDIWTDVSFWFDNQIILSVKDENGWHIVQL